MQVLPRPYLWCPHPLEFRINTDIELVDADVNKPASFTESSERAF